MAVFPDRPPTLTLISQSTFLELYDIVYLLNWFGRCKVCTNGRAVCEVRIYMKVLMTFIVLRVISYIVGWSPLNAGVLLSRRGRILDLEPRNQPRSPVRACRTLA